MFGLTPVTVWDMDAAQFFALVPVMDQIRKQRQKESGNRNTQ